MLGLENAKEVKGIIDVASDLAINKENMEHGNIKSFWLKKKIIEFNH